MKSEIYVIASIIDTSDKSLVGFRIVDMLNKEIKYKDVSYDSFCNIISKYKNLVVNARFIGNTIDTYNSNLNLIDESGKLISRSMYFVVRQLDSLGFTIVDYKGNLKKISNSDILNIKDSLANVHYNSQGLLVPNSSEFTIKTESIKLKVDNSVNNLGISLVTGNSKKIVSISKAEVENNIGKENIFDGLSDNQIKAIQDYYLWYTTDVFNSITSSKRFILKPNKSLTLALMKKDLLWYFGGIKDRGFVGASHCNLGHAIRYEYLAYGVENESDYPSNVKEVIKFGETCSGDFFNIPKEDMKKLIKIRKFMSEEIDLLCSAKKKQVYNGVDTDWNNLWSNVEFLRAIVSDKNLIRLNKAFGNKVGSTLKMFYDLDIPFPDSLVKLACEGAFGNKEFIRSFSKAKEFYSVILDKADKEAVKWIYDNSSNVNLSILCRYLDYACYYILGGKYSYNPLTSTGKRYGAFNKRARYERYKIIYEFREFKGHIETYESFSKIIKFIRYLKYLYDKLEDSIYEKATDIIKIDYRNRIGTLIICLYLIGLNKEYTYGITFSSIFTLCGNIDKTIDFIDSIIDEDFNTLVTSEYYKALADKYIRNIVNLCNEPNEYGITYDNLVVKIKKDIDESFTLEFVYSLTLELKFNSLSDINYSDLVAVGKIIELNNIDINRIEFDNSTLDKVELAFDKVKNLSCTDYKVDIVKDIYNRKLTYDKLSLRQAKIIDAVLDKDFSSSSDANSDSSGDFKDLDSILDKLKREPKLLEELNKKSHIAYNVLLTIKKLGKMSSKQEKYYKLAKDVVKI